MKMVNILIYSIMSNVESFLRTRITFRKLNSSQSIPQLKHLVIESISQAGRNYTFVQKVS